MVHDFMHSVSLRNVMPEFKYYYSKDRMGVTCKLISTYIYIYIYIYWLYIDI